MRSTTLEETTRREHVPSRWRGRARAVDHGKADRAAGFGNGSNRTRLTIGPIGLIFCLANAAIFTAAIARFLKGPQPYDDLVAGSIIWANADKGFDFRVFYVFLAATVLIWTLLVALCCRLQANDAMKATLERGLALALTPGALWLGGQLATNSLGNAPIECGLTSAAVLALFFSLSRRQLGATHQAIASIVYPSLLAFVFAFFSGLGLATMLSRTFQGSNSLNVTIGLVSAICALAFVAVILVVLLSPTTETVAKRMTHVIFGSQVLLPLLCAVLIPPAIVENGQRLMARPSIALVAVLGLTAAAGWTDLFRRWIFSRLSRVSLNQNLAPLAILPIAIFLAVDPGSFPTFFGDDFHLGEHLLPWQQLWDFGKLPFVDFVPIHPLMDMIVGAANSLFFDGTLANYENSRAFLFAIVSVLTFLAVARFAGVGLALCLALAANVWDRLLLVPPVLVVLCHAKLLPRRQAWLLCWFLLCPITALYNPAVGIALTLATIPVSLLQIWKLFVEDRNAFWRVVAVSGGVAGTICLIPSTRAIAFGFAHFLLENGSTVVLAHGLNWYSDSAQMPAERGVLAAPVVWEALRFCWMIVLLVAGWVFVSRARSWRTARPETLAISGLTCLFLFFLAGWTLNRIDPLFPSRTGEVSYLAVLYILPLLLFAAGSWRYMSIPLFVLALGFFREATADFKYSGSKQHSRLTIGTLLEKPTVASTVPPECVSFDGDSTGLSKLGHIYAPPEALASLIGLKAAFNALLRPGETYLDLTNRQANYFYLNMPVAASYGSTWVAANRVLQDRLLGEIKSQPPPVVWIAPAQLHDTGTAAIRTHKLYRYLVDHYVPVLHSRHAFLVEPNRAADFASTPEQKLQILRNAFDNPTLGQLPSAWGSSWTHLAGLFAPALQMRPRVAAPILDGSATFLHAAQSTWSGRDCDFVKFDFGSNVRPPGKIDIDITWASEHGNGAARFTAANGTNLVPLGAYPAWLLSRKISDLRIVPVKPPPHLGYVVEKVELLRLKD